MNLNLNSSHLFNYKVLLTSIGIVAFFLPVFLVITSIVLKDCPFFLTSISAYHFSKASVLFTGTFWAISLFFFAYMGFEKEEGQLLSDNWICNLIGITGIMVSVFPTEAAQGVPQLSWIPWVHYGSALIFLSLLAYLCYYRFVKTNNPECLTSEFISKEENKGNKKWLRNRVYQRMGFIMAACIFLMIIYFVLKRFKLAPDLVDPLTHFIFWGETISLLAFGYAWTVKGELFYADE